MPLDRDRVPHEWAGQNNHGSFPFASSTGDSSYGLFFTPREMELFNDYNTELLGIIAPVSYTHLTLPTTPNV